MNRTRRYILGNGIGLALVCLLSVSCVMTSLEPESALDSKTAPAVDALQPTAATTTDDRNNGDWINLQSRTADGLARLGNPDAPVTFIDYSDFL